MSDDTELPEIHWPIAAALAAEEKLAEDTVVIDVGEVLGITGHFVLATGRNERQVRAIVEEVERSLTEVGGPKPRSVEGREDNVWVLMDYGDFVVHVFETDARAYYDLDRLWSDRPRVPHHT